MIIAIDTEIGGLNPQKDALLSISAVQIDDPENTFNVFILPEDGMGMHPRALEINGYTPELWAERGAVTLYHAMSKFNHWLPMFDEAFPLAHNAPFDKAFIEAAEESVKLTLRLNRRWRCSMTLFMGVNEALGLGAKKFGLETLAKMAGYWPEDYDRGAHQSLDDARACAAGWNWLIKKVKGKDKSKCEHGEGPTDFCEPCGRVSGGG